MSPRTRVKICGLTRIDDIHHAVSAGADSIGLVFYEPSPRHVGLKQGQILARSVPALVSVAALFVNATEQQVKDVIVSVKPDILQFHGEETPEFCAGFGRRYMRAFRVGGPGLDTPEGVLAECRRYPDASAWLFDSFSSGYGGSGLTFDPALLSDVSQWPGRRPIIVAGGLTAATVEASIRSLRPYGIDVSSGVEDAPGIKSERKIKAFMASVYNASR